MQARDLVLDSRDDELPADFVSDGMLLAEFDHLPNPAHS
jgi:hypothetical protein